jgi:hypothetical protein
MHELWLHYKQGDDLKHLLKNSKTSTEAFETWAKSFESNQEVCLEIAKALKDSTIEIEADTHYIGLNPKTEQDEFILEKLFKKELITKSEVFDEDDEFYTDEEVDFIEDNTSDYLTPQTNTNFLDDLLDNSNNNDTVALQTKLKIN